MRRKYLHEKVSPLKTLNGGHNLLFDPAPCSHPLLLIFIHQPAPKRLLVGIYVFQQVRQSPGSPNWTSILTFDLWQHGTYRPLSHLLLYLEHLAFGSWFIGNHLLNFAFYCLSIVLLYLLSRKLGTGRLLAAAFFTVYAFLFTHFDIVTWTFQLFSTMSFCAFLLGFILYLKFLEKNSYLLLPLIGLLFLFGMLCSEAYFFWPAAIILLKLLSRNPGWTFRPGRDRSAGFTAGFLLIIYLLYFAGFYYHRTANATTGELPALNIGQVVISISSVFFNFFYNGLLANLAPIINAPANIYHNIELGGLLIEWEKTMVPIVITGGMAGMILTFFGIRALWRKRGSGVFLRLLFPVSLYCGYFLVLSLARQSTDHISYTLVQFRYQYVPNALTVLTALLAVTYLLRPTRRERIIICGALLPILLINAYFSNLYQRTINRQLFPLRVVLKNIKDGMDQGLINEKEKLYIEEELPINLPSLCWNPDMGRFMEGSYQWIFHPDTMEYFTSTPETAAWKIKEDDFMAIYRLGRNGKTIRRYYRTTTADRKRAGQNP